MNNYIFFLALLSLSIKASFAGSHFNKVVVIIFENTDYNDALKQPYFSTLVKEGALATNYYALTHPSQPNYIGLIAGSTFNVKTDQNVDLNEKHIGDLLEEAKLSWKVYAEGFPGKCFLGSRNGSYARKHVPFLSFTNVSQNPERCSNIKEASQFELDFKSGSLPNFSLYIPNMENDGHNTNIAYGDQWLKKYFDSYLRSSKWQKDLLLIITFDEGTIFSNNKILTLFWGANVKPAAVTNRKYDHYSMLRMIEEEFSLGSLGTNDNKSEVINDIWK